LCYEDTQLPDIPGEFEVHRLRTQRHYDDGRNWGSSMIEYLRECTDPYIVLMAEDNPPIRSNREQYFKLLEALKFCPDKIYPHGDM
jgi:hypothetical protein